MSQKDHQRDNEVVGSALHCPIWDIVCKKHNGGIMHTGSGHINHMWMEISLAIRAYMKGCKWQMRIRNIGLKISVKIEEIEGKIKTMENDEWGKKIRSEIRAIRKRMKDASNALAMSVLEEQEEDLRERLRDRSDNSSLGDLNLLLAGLKELQDVLGNNKEESNRPRSDLEFVLWKAIETRAGGKLDHKQSGRDQTNASGLTSIKNSSKVFEALLGMYPVGNEVRDWLSDEIPK